MSITSFTSEFRFLSNFWPAKVMLDGEEYPTVEHAYQAAKTDDKAMREKIRKADSPNRAKQLGKKAKLKDGFESIKLAVMHELVLQKFQLYPGLADKLMATGDEKLIEGNWWGDKFWGKCNGVGENHLGKILMDIRTTLRPKEVD